MNMLKNKPGNVLPYNPRLTEDRKDLAIAFLRTLVDRGFEVIEAHSSHGGELVFQKVHANRMVITCFTSIVETSNGAMVREVATDAVRCNLSYIKDDGSIRQLGKERRVNRVGDIPGMQKRLGERIDALLERANSGDPKLCCNDCGAPLFVAKSSGKDTCAEVCWILNKEFTLKLAQKGMAYRVLAIKAEERNGKFVETAAWLHNGIFEGATNPNAWSSAINFLSTIKEAACTVEHVANSPYWTKK